VGSSGGRSEGDDLCSMLGREDGAEGRVQMEVALSGESLASPRSAALHSWVWVSRASRHTPWSWGREVAPGWWCLASWRSC